MVKYVGSLAVYPARTVVLGYILLIAVGGLCLTLPMSGAGGRDPIRLIDGIFTATSATCVTGLASRSIGNDFSLTGQVLVMALAQIGGIGIMTITTLATLSFGSAETLRARSVLSETLGLGGLDSWGILRQILLVTFTLETLGALLLCARFYADMPLEKAFYFGVFHSIMAFCNAGFGLYDDNLCRYVGDVTVNLTIVGLLVLGGIGFPTYEDARRLFSSRNRVDWHQLRMQTKVVITMAAVLLVGGAIMILILEWNKTMADLPIHQRFLAAIFQAATPRTAGFNTLPIEKMSEATLFVIILLMFIGASPCSTGGGVKTSTVACVIYSSLSRMRGEAEVTIYRRTLPSDLIERAIAIILLYLFVCTLGIVLLLMTEAANPKLASSPSLFRDCTFEAFSALGTVGLSTGITGKLSDMGKIVLIILMYIGRIGPITLAVFVSREVRHRRVEYAKENLLIG
ncbi:Trk family potassium uptake protein [bacterium]|nr:Trk family potassium uptake protein [bacterium]